MTNKLALSETFTDALYSLCEQSRGYDYYVAAYVNYATNELVRYAADIESDFMPFIESAADSDSRVFNEWVDSEVPLRINGLAELWIKLGCPEPEYSGQCGIEERIRHAVRDYIAERARDAADRLGALIIEFKDQLDEALEADGLEADELEAAEELARYGIRSNYAGMYSISREDAGCVVQLVFDSAVSALAAYHEANA